MSEDNKNLPSINDFMSEEELPSVEDFIEVINEEEDLPSVEDYIEKEEEEIQEETIEETVVETEDLTEVLRLINDVRRDIPDIPEVKYYDDELAQLSEQITQIQTELSEAPEVRYYESEVEEICEQIDTVRQEIKNLPEVKYYDEQVDAIEDRIDSLQTELTNLPEVKYYDSEIQAIREAIGEVASSIPTFPKWVNEVNEVPDFSWIGKTFSVIDDDFIKINDVVETLKERVDFNLNQLSEDIDKKKFESKVELETKSEEIETKIQEEKDKIWKELRESSLRIWEHHKTFKDDDRKLKKQILGEYNKLKNELKESIKKTTDESVKTDELLLKYFNDLKEEVGAIVIPEVKNYDWDIKALYQTVGNVKRDVSELIGELYKIASVIKTQQKQLNEVALEEPHNVPQSVGGAQDPLTPIDPKFATFKDLREHYQIFINRIQTQLSAVGGGGAGRIPDLDDVDFDVGIGTGKLLIFNGAKWVGIASTAITGSAGIAQTDFISGIAITMTTGNFTGNVTVGGTITYQDVRHIDAVGIITAQQGIQILNNGLNVSGVITSVGAGGTVTIGAGQTALHVDGDARVVGILTIGRSSVTIDGTTNTVTIGDENVVISNSAVTIGDNVSIQAGASGINSAPNVLYVAKDGSDSNNGTSIDNAFLTIKFCCWCCHIWHDC